MNWPTRFSAHGRGAAVKIAPTTPEGCVFESAKSPRPAGGGDPHANDNDWTLGKIPHKD